MIEDEEIMQRLDVLEINQNRANRPTNSNRINHRNRIQPVSIQEANNNSPHTSCNDVPSFLRSLRRRIFRRNI